MDYFSLIDVQTFYTCPKKIHMFTNFKMFQSRLFVDMEVWFGSFSDQAESADSLLVKILDATAASAFI